MAVNLKRNFVDVINVDQRKSNKKKKRKKSDEIELNDEI